MKTSLRFEDLPIVFLCIEHKDGWERNVKREGRISELLEIWDIDDPGEGSEIAQVLRYLRSGIEKQKELEQKHEELLSQIVWAVAHYGIVNTEGIFEHLRKVILDNQEKTD